MALLGSFFAQAQMSLLLVHGPTEVCRNETAQYSAGGSRCSRSASWNWTVSGGYIISGQGTSSIRVRWTSSGVGRAEVSWLCPSGFDGMGLGGSPDQITGLGDAAIGAIEVQVGGSAPSTPNVSGATACSETQTVRLTVNTRLSGYTYHWYTSSTGGVPITTTGPRGYYHEVQVNQTFYVSADKGACESSRRRVSAVVVAPP